MKKTIIVLVVLLILACVILYSEGFDYTLAEAENQIKLKYNEAISIKDEEDLENFKILAVTRNNHMGICILQKTMFGKYKLLGFGVDNMRFFKCEITKLPNHENYLILAVKNPGNIVRAEINYYGVDDTDKEHILKETIEIPECDYFLYTEKLNSNWSYPFLLSDKTVFFDENGNTVTDIEDN